MNIFTKHPKQVGMTYPEHCLFAANAGMHLLAAGISCLIHSLFPFVFEKTASTMTRSLYRRFTSSEGFCDGGGI